MTDTPNRNAATTARRPDCVTEVRRGNTVLVVSGYFKQDTTATAADKMMKVLEAESAAGGTAAYAPTLGKLTKLLSGDFTFFNESIFR